MSRTRSTLVYKELFTDLLKAEREEDVTDALTVFGLEKFSDSNWLPYGGIENNYGIIGAQQADAIGALVEKVVNSIDAVLMRECFARNLDPRSNLVPRSMAEAAEQFLNIPDGNLAKWSVAQRTELAERNISIIVTGQKPSEGNPCVIIADTGEGQKPEDFKDTLVSLGDFLRKHPGLREWNERRHRETVEEQFAEESESIELFEKLVAQNPALAEILGIGLKIKVPRPGDQPTPKFDGQRFPTFLTLEDAHQDGEFVKKCPQNSYCRVILLTDVENDYLVRAFEPGKLIIRPEALVKCTSLYNGRLELQLAPDNAYDVGHRMEVKVMLTSPNSPEGYFSVRFWLEIDSPAQPKKHSPTSPKPPRVSTLALPEIKEIKKDGWSDSIEITSDEDVVTIMGNGDQPKTSLVNMDNRHYQRYVYANPKREQEIRNIYKISSTIMGLWLLEQVDKGDLEDAKRRTVSNSLGKLLLPMVDSLGSKLAELEAG